MAKQQAPRKPGQPQAPQSQPQPAQVKKQAPAPARRPAEKRETLFSAGSRELIYGRQNFMLMGIGLLLVLLGLAVMSGGAMPDPKVWEPERIYSFRRITLAPIMMVVGFLVVGLGIFKRNTTAETAVTTPETPDTNA